MARPEKPIPADASTQLRALAQHLRDLRTAARLTLAGIDVHDSPLLAGPRGQQLAGRFKLLTHDPLPHGTETQRQVWHNIVGDMENALRLRRHRPGALTRHSAYLHQRTAGVIGSLAHLIKEAAIIAITDHAEKITKTLLDDIEVDIRAQHHYLTHPHNADPPAPHGTPNQCEQPTNQPAQPSNTSRKPQLNTCAAPTHASNATMDQPHRGQPVNLNNPSSQPYPLRTTNERGHRQQRALHAAAGRARACRPARWPGDTSQLGESQPRGGVRGSGCRRA